MLQGLYLSTLIVRVTGDTGMTLIYNLVFYNVATVGHLVGAVLVRRLPAIYCTRLCSVLYLGMYATLLFGMDQLGVLWPLVATFCGLAAAFNYIAYMILLLDCTEDETRDRSLSYIDVYKRQMPERTGIAKDHADISLLALVQKSQKILFLMNSRIIMGTEHQVHTAVFPVRHILRLQLASLGVVPKTHRIRMHCQTPLFFIL